MKYIKKILSFLGYGIAIGFLFYMVALEIFKTQVQCSDFHYNQDQWICDKWSGR